MRPVVSEEPLVERLLAVGLLTPDEAAGATSTSTRRERCVVTHIAVHATPRYVVKAPLHREAVPLLNREAAILRSLHEVGGQDLAPHLDAALPPATLVTRYLDARPGGADDPESLGATVAARLGDLHRATLARPGGPRVTRLMSDVPARLWPRLAWAARAEAAASASLAFLAASWCPAALIHGDVKVEHVRHGGALIDWELGGMGDPAWDVASLLQELCMAGVSSTSVGVALRVYGSHVQRPLGEHFLRRCRAALAVRCLQSVGEYEAAGASAQIVTRAQRLARWWAEHPGSLERCLAEAA